MPSLPAIVRDVWGGMLGGPLDAQALVELAERERASQNAETAGP